MDLFAPNYSLLAILAAVLAGFVAGRVTAVISGPRRRETDRHRQLSDALIAEQNLARLSEAVRSRMETLVAEGRTIEAIRDCRAELGLGLKEAKDVVDLMREREWRGARAP